MMLAGLQGLIPELAQRILAGLVHHFWQQFIDSQHIFPGSIQAQLEKTGAAFIDRPDAVPWLAF